MEEEKEIKVEILENLTIDDLKKILEKNFNVVFSNFEEEKDVYFDFKDSFFFNINHSIRIRKTSNNSSFAYKALFNIPSRKSNPWFVLEHESEIPLKKNFFQDFFNLINLDSVLNEDNYTYPKVKNELIKNNFEEKIIIYKKRYVGLNGDLKVIIDFVENLGLFIEFEIKKGDLMINYLLKKLPFKFKEIRFGYTNLYAERVLNMKIPNFDREYKNNWKWNFLSGQEQIITKLIKNEK